MLFTLKDKAEHGELHKLPAAQRQRELWHSGSVTGPGRDIEVQACIRGRLDRLRPFGALSRPIDPLGGEWSAIGITATLRLGVAGV
jgi:hypothetical protein